MGMWLSKVLWAAGVVCLTPAPFNLSDLGGILTGMPTLACVILLKTNRRLGPNLYVHGAGEPI